MSADASSQPMPLLRLQADDEDLRHAEMVADRKVELLGRERDHHGQRQQGP